MDPCLPEALEVDHHDLDEEDNEDTYSSSSEEYDPEDILLLEEDGQDLDHPEDEFKTSPCRRPRKVRSAWFLIRNYVLSVWQILEAKMLSSMSYTPPEVFAYNLKSKLESLSSSEAASAAMPRSVPALASNRLRLLLESHEHILGTTFPPSRCIPMEQQKASRFHSETNLSTSWEGAQDLQDSKEDHPKDLEDEERQDSDLFFDFDINSPNIEEDSEMVENDFRRCSESSVENLPDTGTSTAFGSTSSGLYSDSESKSIDQLEDNGFCISPENWLKSNYSDMLKNKELDKTPEASSPCPSSNVQDVSSDETIDGSDDKTTICIGDTEKMIAKSKLTSLISLLEKDRTSFTEVTRSRTSTIGKPSSPPKSPEKAIIPAPRVASKPVLGTSPANFSFLSGAMASEARNNESLEVISPSLERSNSTSLLSDIKKTHSRLMSESSEAASTVGSLQKKESLHSLADENEKNEEENKAKYRRCSSLKSGKTPPGTPGRRKIVRFADVFGLDLADVKTFFDEVPKVPKSAFKDLADAELSDLESDSGSERTFPVLPPTAPPPTSTTTKPASTLATPTFSPLFSQPSGNADFFNRLRDQKVKLESAYMCDISTVKGIVRVVNLDFHKSVFVKYTTDEWASTTDVQAAYMPGSCDGFSDKFVFTIDVSGIKGHVGKKVHFCLCFTCSSNQYWDNNGGRNYTFQCFGAPNVQRSTSAAIPVRNTSYQPSQPQPRPIGHYGMSQSPSAMGDDPWQRYL